MRQKPAPVMVRIRASVRLVSMARAMRRLTRRRALLDHLRVHVARRGRRSLCITRCWNGIAVFDALDHEAVEGAALMRAIASSRVAPVR